MLRRSSATGLILPCSQKMAEQCTRRTVIGATMAQTRISRTLRDTAARSRIIAILSQEQSNGGPLPAGSAGSFRSSTHAAAYLGSCRDRKHEPGHQIMWHGQSRLASASLGHQIGSRQAANRR